MAITDGPITRDDIKAKFGELESKAQDTAESARNTLIAVGVAAAVVIGGLAFVLGRRRGKKKRPSSRFAESDVLKTLRSRGLAEGFLGGSRLWTVLGALGWFIKAVQWATKKEPEIVYRAELQPGETLVLAREGKDTAKQRVKRRPKRR